jgi:OmpA-OmpF porin, OOP family
MSVKTLSVALVTLGTLSLCSAAFADQNDGHGIYIGGQVGYGKAGYGSDIRDFFKSAPNSNTDEGGIAGRGYVGYQFNQYIGIETGYTIFSDHTYKGYDSYNGYGLSVEDKLKTDAWDILGKVGMPFGNSGFSGNVKAGVAYIMAKSELSASSSGTTVSVSDETNAWKPVAGAGVAYNFNKNLAVDVSYLHYFGSNSHLFDRNISAPNADFVGVGISYRFA